MRTIAVPVSVLDICTFVFQAGAGNAVQGFLSLPYGRRGNLPARTRAKTTSPGQLGQLGPTSKRFNARASLFRLADIRRNKCKYRGLTPA